MTNVPSFVFQKTKIIEQMAELIGVKAEFLPLEVSVSVCSVL